MDAERPGERYDAERRNEDYSAVTTTSRDASILP
jgi:hypothetical protein